MYRLPFRSVSNASSVVPSTPAAPPLDRTCRYASYTSLLSMLNGLLGVVIGVLLSPVAPVARPPDPIPSLLPRYGPSSLLRIGPSQCSASVLSPCGFLRLSFSLGIGATGSCSSTITPASASRPLNAGRRPPSHQAPGELIPGGRHTPGFDDTLHVTTLLRWVHFRSSLGCAPVQGVPLDLSPTLTTTPLERSRLEWFGTCS